MAASNFQNNSIEKKTDKTSNLQKTSDDQNFSPKSTEVKVDVLKFPYFPRELKLQHLNAKGNLEDDQESQILDEELLQSESNSIYQYEKDHIYPVFRISTTRHHYTIYDSPDWQNENNSNSDSDSEDEFKNHLSHYLGQGAHNPVYICQHSKTKNFLALKIVKEDGKFSPKQFEVQQKAGSLGQFLMEPNRKDRAFLMKLARGINLKKYVDQRTPNDLPDYRRIEIVLGMLLCLLEIKSKKIIHRDIKLGNFTFDPVRRSVTLVDFDTALTGPAIEGEECIGTPGFIAPEHKRPDNNFVCYASDVYSMGMTIADLFGLISEKTMQYPRESLHYNGHQLNPNNAKFFEIFKDETLRQEIFQFIKKMTNEDPEKRPTVSQCLEFFGDIYVKLLQQKTFKIGLVNLADLIQPNPKKKNKSFKDKFNKIVNSLKEKKFDDVWFIDVNGKFTDIQKEQVKRRLLRRRISIADKIFCAPGAKVEDVIAQIPEISKQKNDPRQYELIRFIPPKSKKEFSRANRFFKYEKHEALIQKIPLSQNYFSVLASAKGR